MKKKKEIKPENWTRFLKEAMLEEFDEDSNTNFKIPFKDLTKKFGSQYIAYVKAAWEANDGVLTEDEFCAINGDMPKGFFNKFCKGK